MVRVLILIDEDVAESSLIRRRNLRVRTEKPHRLRDEIIEVKGTVALQLSLILPVDFKDELLSRVR